MVIKKTGSDSGLFVYNGLEYIKGEYSIFYNNVVLSGGSPDLDVVEVGIKTSDEKDVIASPSHYSDWVNGDTMLPFTSTSELVGYISESIILPSSGGGGGGDASAANQDVIITQVDASGDYEQELRTTARTFALNEIKELSFEVVSGTVDVTIGGNLVTYPLPNDIVGLNNIIDNTGLGEIIFTPAASSSVLIVYKLV